MYVLTLIKLIVICPSGVFPIYWERGVDAREAWSLSPMKICLDAVTKTPAATSLALGSI